MLKCITCSNPLRGRQKKFCSSLCKNTNNNLVYQVYENQQRRGWQRKRGLVELYGGCCSECGYKKNLSALCFHHTRDKEFPLTIRELSNRNWLKLLAEAEKCVLLCANCHLEHHHPAHKY